MATTRKRRPAGDGGFSAYQTKAGQRFLIKYRMPAADGIGTRQGLYRKLEREGRADGTGGLSARTVRYIHTIVHRALGDAVDDGTLAVNPADRAKPPTSAQAKAPELRYWTPEQLGTFLAWSQRDEDELFPAWQLLAATGKRRGEALGLRWGDVDMAAGRVSIRRSAVLVKNHGAGESIEIGPPKSGRARVVDIDPRTVAVLKAHRSALAELDLRLTREDAPVLPTLAGEVRHPERFSRTFVASVKRAAKALGEQAPPPIRLHDLRHTHATALLVAGVHAKIVQERLGHATISITLDTYSYVIPTMQRDAADQFAMAVYGS